MSFKVEIDKDAIGRAEVLLYGLKNGFETAISRAVNRALTTARSETVKATREHYTVKAKDVRKTISLKRATRQNLNGEMVSRGASIPAHHFSIRPRTDTTGRKRRPIDVEIKKGHKFKVTTGFVWNSRLYKRSSRARLPIETMLGPAVPQMITNEEVGQQIIDKATETFNKRIVHETEQIMEKGK